MQRKGIILKAKEKTISRPGQKVSQKPKHNARRAQLVP